MQQNIVDAAVDRLNVAVTQATDLALPSGYIKMYIYTALFSGKSKACIKKRNHFIDVTRNIRLTACMRNFLFSVN
jgi:hypothetical protein